MAKYKKTCVCCGKSFETDYKQRKYCDNQCAYEINAPGRRERQARYQREQRAKKENLMQFIQSKGTIDEINEKARQAGMSYGKYEALKQSQKEIAERQKEREQGIRFFDRYIKAKEGDVKACRQQ